MFIDSLLFGIYVFIYSIYNRVQGRKAEEAKENIFRHGDIHETKKKAYSYCSLLFFLYGVHTYNSGSMKRNTYKRGGESYPHHNPHKNGGFGDVVYCRGVERDKMKNE